MDYHFRLVCDQAGKRAEIVPYAVWNTNVYSEEPQDCRLASGRTVRAKMGLGPIYPYGQGGADPSKWISVWIDEARVLNEYGFECLAEGPCGIRVVVTPDGMEVCSRERSRRSSPPDVDGQPPERCAITLNKDLSAVRDALEYPVADERRRPAAGSIAMLYARDEQFCEIFQYGGTDNNSSRVDLPVDAKPVEAENRSDYEYAGSYYHYTFDIDNDGRTERVVGLEARTHAHDGDIFFVYRGETVPKPIVQKAGKMKTMTVYAKAAARILPQYWSDYAGAAERRLAVEGDLEGAYAVTSVASPWWNNEDTPIFRFRYWYLRPFRYDQTTYFLTSSREASRLHWHTVLRPEPDGHVTEMCVFQIVPVRY